MTPAFSQELTDHKPGKWWKASLVALAGATVADAASSWDRIEANPVLRGSDGRFGARGLGFKLGIAGTVAFTQYMLAKRGPQAERVAVFANFAAAGAFGAAAVHNWSRNSARPAMPSYLAR